MTTDQEQKAKSKKERALKVVKAIGWVTMAMGFIGSLAWGTWEHMSNSKTQRENAQLRRKNEELEQVNTEQRGENKALYRENRKLSNENGNLNYQLGKKAAAQGQGH